jgi:hypothetical protein
MRPQRISTRRQRCTTGKRRFRDRQEAKQVLTFIRTESSRDKVPVRVYFCADCNGWHMTSWETPTETERRCKHGFGLKVCIQPACVVERINVYGA